MNVVDVDYPNYVTSAKKLLMNKKNLLGKNGTVKSNGGAINQEATWSA